MALGELSQVIPRSATDVRIDGNAGHCVKQSIQSLELRGPGSVPEFCNRYRRAGNDGFATAELCPSGQQGGVPAAGYVDQNIGINQDAFQRILSNREPFLSART